MDPSDNDLAPTTQGFDSEGRFIEAFIRGDRAAADQIDRWIEVVLRDQAASVRAEWDDLKQEVRVRVFRNLSRSDFKGRSSLRTYVHRIAKNACIDLLRSLRRRDDLTAAIRDPPPTGEKGSDAATAVTAKDLVQKIFHGLSEEDRTLFELVFVEHCSYAEVAKRLSIPEGTVKSRMSRCKNRILERRRRLVAPERRES